MYSVTVQRINENLHDPQSFTILARRVTIEEDGALDIIGDEKAVS